MSPRAARRMPGSTSRQAWCAPTAWVFSTRSSSAGSVSATDNPREAMPALHTNKSTGPRSAVICSTIARIASASSTDAAYARAIPPAASIAATVSAAASASRRKLTATAAPCCASCSLIARPIPRPPPVTSAIRPVN